MRIPIFLSVLLFFFGSSSVTFGQSLPQLHPDDDASIDQELFDTRWPNGVVPYVLEIAKGDDDNPRNFSEPDFYNLNDWRELTDGAVRFIPRTTEATYIRIILGERNQTNGLRGIKEQGGARISGERVIYIRPSTSHNSNHELGHALGLWHQQRHPDSTRCVQLSAQSALRIDRENFIGNYSSDSIMHYLRDSDDFVSWLDDESCPELGATELPSEFDVNYLKKLYGANAEYGRDTSFCSVTGDKVYHGDFDGDGREDLMCHRARGNSTSGVRHIFLSRSDGNGPFDRRASRAYDRASGDGNRFCANPDRALLVADVNNDGRDDLVCHDKGDGRRFVDYSDEMGFFDVADIILPPFCTGVSVTLHAGDFDGDGRTDFLCHGRAASEDLTLERGANGLNGQDWSLNQPWCVSRTATIHIGRLNDDAMDDVLCHERIGGQSYVRYGRVGGSVSRVDFRPATSAPTTFPRFCGGRDNALHIADANGEGPDEVICHSRKGDISTRYWPSMTPGQVAGTEFGYVRFGSVTRTISFCNLRDATLYIGEFRSDPALAGDRLLCHNSATGHLSIRTAYAR